MPMAYFVVNYDLKEGQDYKPIIDALESLGGVRALESFWLIDLNNTTLEAKNHFATYLPTPAKDKLMVVQFSERPRFTRAFTAAVDWIKEHFPD